MERECKSKEYYTKRLTAYKKDTRMYKEVVYVVNEKRVAKRMLEAKELSGFDRMIRKRKLIKTKRTIRKQ